MFGITVAGPNAPAIVQYYFVLGIVTSLLGVNRFLTANFEHYVDYGFTASMEDELDNISRGEEDWLPMLERFWDDLKQQVDDVSENVTRSDVAMERPLGIDPVSGRPVSVRYGRFGAFAQIGTRDDEEKPKFASLKPGQRMDDLTLDLALELAPQGWEVASYKADHTVTLTPGGVWRRGQHHVARLGRGCGGESARSLEWPGGFTGSPVSSRGYCV